MGVFDAIAARRSIRRYKPDQIPEGKLRRVMEAARLAPSAGNRQPFRFVITKDDKLRREIARACDNQDFIAEAPVIMTVLGDRAASPRWYQKDPMIATEHIALQAVEEGLGTCWIGAFDEAELKRVLTIPGDLKVICVMPIGIPAENPAPTQRKQLKEIFCRETYGKPYES